MLKRFSTNYALFSIFLDGVLAAFALRLAFLIRPSLSHFSVLIKDRE